MPHARSKYVSLLLIVALCAPLGAALVAGPQHAQASVPTFEMNPLLTKVQTKANVVDSIKNTFQLGQQLYEWAFKLAVEALKKRLLDMLVDQIIAWVQGGGAPKFITDWQGFLLDAANAGAGDIVKQLGLGFLCSPFNLQIKLALSPIPKFSQRASCTLDKIVGNIQNFYKDFRNGRWIAYQTAWKPSGNFWGTAIIVHDEALREGANRAVAAAQEGTANQGFLSTKRCVQKQFDDDGVEIGCAKFEVTTPGKTIGDLTSRAVAADIDWLVNADDLAAYVSAIANAVINRLVREGVSGLQALTTPSAPEGGYVGAGVTGACVGLTGQARTDCLRLKQTSKEKLIGDKDAIISNVTSVLDEDKLSKTAKEGTLLTTQLTVGRLQQLKACDPSLSGVDQQITAYQNKATVVANEIAALNQKIADMEAFIERVKGISEGQEDILARAVTESQTFGDPASAAVASDLAEKEKSDAETPLASITSELQACLANQALLQQQQQPPQTP